jgi:hypothetical protein
MLTLFDRPTSPDEQGRAVPLVEGSELAVRLFG